MKSKATKHSRWRAAIFAALAHFGCSLLVAVVIALLVFYFYFPYPYRDIVGGKELFWLIISVDVVCGPLLTAVIFDRRKPRRELVMDLGFIALIQVLALAYGLSTLWQARPVYLVFEVDRFRVVTYADIKKDELQPETESLHRLSWYGGVQLLGTRAPRDNAEEMESLDFSIQGYDPSTRPSWWQDYALSIAEVKQRAHSAATLIQKKPQQAQLVRDAIAQIGKTEEGILWLPVTSFRSAEWIVLLDKNTAQPVTFLPIDGF